MKVKMDKNILHLLFLLEMRNKQVELNMIIKLHWCNIIKMLQFVFNSVVYHMYSLMQEKIILQGLLQCELGNHYTFIIRVIGIGLNLIILSWNTKWITWVSIIPIVTIINGKTGQFWDSPWHQWNFYLVTVNGWWW